MKNDFKIIEEYEKLIFKDTAIEIMFIMDLTGSIGIWLNEAKNNKKKITEKISDKFPIGNKLDNRKLIIIIYLIKNVYLLIYMNKNSSEFHRL